ASLRPPSLTKRKRRFRCTGFPTSTRPASTTARSTSGAAANRATRFGVDGDRAAVITKYSRWLRDQHHLLRDLDELRGKDLLCFCALAACHGDLLLRLANASREERIAWWRSAG